MIVRYAAMLRGVSPLNAKMPALRAAFEAAGFTNVKTLLSSGNVVFETSAAAILALQTRAERAMQSHLGRTFMTFIRSVDELRALLEPDPFAAWKVPRAAKRVITFLHEPAPAIALPPMLHDAQIHGTRDRYVFSTYVSGPKGPVFMALIEKTFGKDVTTRTWDTVRKLAA